jgi:hypothetical protein
MADGSTIMNKLPQVNALRVHSIWKFHGILKHIIRN